MRLQVFSKREYLKQEIQYNSLIIAFLSFIIYVIIQSFLKIN